MLVRWSLSHARARVLSLLPCSIGTPTRFVHATRPSGKQRIKPNLRLEEAEDGELISFAFLERGSGDKIMVEGNSGRTVLDVALDNNVDIEGACGGELACSTCHVIVAEELYRLLPKKKVEEDDMLDLATELTPTSRLCCQLKVSPIIKNALFVVPNDAL